MNSLALQEDDDEYEKLIRPIMMTGKISTFWPLQPDPGKSAVFFRKFHVCFILFLMVLTLVTGIADVVHNLHDLDEATECALLCSAFGLALVRLLVYNAHQKDMSYVVKTMQEDWLGSTSEEKAVLREKTLFAFRLAKFFITTVAGTIGLFACAPVADIYLLDAEERVLPFRGYFVFINQTESPTYQLLYLVNVTAGGFCGSTIAAATSFNLVVIIHGSAKFAVVRKKLEALDSEDPNSEGAMADCVIRHQEAIAFADALERIINVLALGQFVTSTGLICFAGFQLTSMMEDRGRLMKYSAFLNSATLELFMFSFSGNELMDESGAVGFSAYDCRWVGARFHRSLQIVMMRSRVPNQITAAKFYSMSLESFAKVLSTSFSYFTVLSATES